MYKMGKLYKDLNLTEPFQVTFDNQTFDAYANEDDTITIGSTSYLRVKDSTGRSVKAVIDNASSDGKAHQLIVRLNEGEAGDLCYIEGEGAEAAAMGTNIQVIDAVMPPTYTINYEGNQGIFIYESLPYEGQIDPAWDWKLTFTLDPSDLIDYGDTLTLIYSQNPQIELLACVRGELLIDGTKIRDLNFDPSQITEYVREFSVSKSGNWTASIYRIDTQGSTTLNGSMESNVSGIVSGLTPAQVASNLKYRPDMVIDAVLDIYSS